MPRLLISSPHRYPDLARLWHRVVMRELVPAFERLRLDVEVNIFCDANADQFFPHLFPGVRFTGCGPGMRDFMEFYDATLFAPYDFVLFLDADTFLLDGAWAASHFKAFNDPNVAAISYVPRKGRPAIFALLCRTESFRTLPAPILACRWEFPEQWPGGENLQPGDFAVRQLTQRGKSIVNISAEESLRHIANFRGTTGLRAARELTTRAVSEEAFLRSAEAIPAYFVAAYDNALLGCLYESLYHEPFALDDAERPLGSSLTLDELNRAMQQVRDQQQRDTLRQKFENSHRNILRMAALEGIALTPPPIPQFG